MAATSRETTGTVHKKTQDPYQQRVNPDVRQPMATTNRPLYSTNEFMRACTWQGTEQVTIEERPKPLITDQTDAIVRMESVTLCGSDLHLYTNSLDPAGAMMKGDILGHEGVGVVEAVGSAVKNVKPGDKVVISFGIACGSCEYCQREEYTSCDRTNPSSQIEQLYGHRMGAAFGYSHLTGGYDGLQAEFARVPFADVNLLVVPKDTPLQNDQLIMLSDIACTGWHGAECAKVTEGDDVGIWGAGPVGLMAAMWCKYRGAKRVVIIDNEQYRLDRARARLGVEILNFDDLPGNKSLTDTIMEMFPRGLDACIDCVGFRFPSTFLHKVERVLRLETDALDVIDQMSIVTRKWGRIALLGDYFGYGNHFPIGRIMEKSINILGGQALAQKYWKNLYDIIAKGDVDPAHVVVSHVLPFNQIVKAYDMFNKHQDEALKIILEMTPSSMIGTHSSVGTQSSFGTTSRSTTTTTTTTKAM